MVCAFRYTPKESFQSRRLKVKRRKNMIPSSFSLFNVPPYHNSPSICLATTPILRIRANYFLQPFRRIGRPNYHWSICFPLSHDLKEEANEEHERNQQEREAKNQEVNHGVPLTHILHSSIEEERNFCLNSPIFVPFQIESIDSSNIFPRRWFIVSVHGKTSPFT